MKKIQWFHMIQKISNIWKKKFDELCVVVVKCVSTEKKWYTYKKSYSFLVRSYITKYILKAGTISLFNHICYGGFYI